MNSLILAAALSGVQLAHPPFPGGPFPPAPPPVPTVEQFAAGFQPTPGHHRVWVLHPATRQPVQVCFTLPAGFPRIDFGRKYVEYDFGRIEVEIRFRNDGTVDVDYDD